MSNGPAFCNLCLDNARHFLGEKDKEIAELKAENENLLKLLGHAALTPEGLNQLEVAQAQLTHQSTLLKQAKELIDGCMPMIEATVCISSAQLDWKKEWLDKAKQTLTALEKGPDAN